MVTNTTYAGLSMRDGDSFGKQLVHQTMLLELQMVPMAKTGFLLQIIPLDENNQVVGDTVDFYLADFVLVDNNQDYILNTWETVQMNDVLAKKIDFQIVFF
ncbi:MAG: DUF4465 domain-containing protein [Crocinitomicaceae bacterium]